MSSRLTTRLRDLRRRWLLGWLLAVPVLAAAALAAFSYFLLPPFFPKNYGLFDMRYYHAPHAYLLDVSLENGELPLWNPLVNCGTPFAANPQTAMFYPPHLIRALLNSDATPATTSATINIELLLHLVFSGMGAFMLARAYGLTVWARFTAAFTYMLGPFFVANALEFWHLISVASWLPWLLLLTRNALESPTCQRKLWFSAAAGLAFGMSILAGFPQLNFYTAVTLVLFCALDRAFAWPGGRAALWHAPKSVGNGAAILAALFGIGALTAAALLLPTLELAQLSARVRSSGLQEMSWSQDLSFKTLLPSLAIYPGATAAATQGIRAAGITALLLAVASLFHCRKRAVAVFLLLFLILMDCSLGPPLPFGTLMWYLDYCNFGSPWRVALLCSLPFAMLTAFGVDAVSRRFESKAAQTGRTALLTSVGLAAILALWGWYRHEPYMEVHPAVFFIPAAGFAVMLCAGFLRWPAFWRFLIALLLVSEIVVWDLHFVPFYAGGRVWKIAPPHIGETQTIVANNDRGASVRPNLDMLYLKPVINGYDPLYLNRVRQAICSPRGENAVYTTLHLDNVIVENPRSTLLLKRNFWLSRQYVDGPLPPKTQLFPAATTVFLENPGDLIVPEADSATLPRSGVSEEAERVDIADASALAGLHKAGAANKMSLRLPPFHPGGVHGVLCLRYAASIGAYLDLQFNDPVKNVATKGARQRISPTRSGYGLLEIPLPDAETVLAMLEWTAPAGSVVFTEAYALLDRADENSLITVVSRTANTADLDIAALSGPRILSFLDADYPGWKAWVDGEATPVLRADDVFKAVVLPAGAHHVRFAFRPWRVYAGMAISLLTVTATLALLAFRRPKNEPIPEN